MGWLSKNGTPGCSARLNGTFCRHFWRCKFLCTLVGLSVGGYSAGLSAGSFGSERQKLSCLKQWSVMNVCTRVITGATPHSKPHQLAHGHRVGAPAYPNQPRTRSMVDKRTHTHTRSMLPTVPETQNALYCQFLVGIARTGLSAATRCGKDTRLHALSLVVLAEAQVHATKLLNDWNTNCPGVPNHLFNGRQRNQNFLPFFFWGGGGGRGGWTTAAASYNVMQISAIEATNMSAESQACSDSS